MKNLYTALATALLAATTATAQPLATSTQTSAKPLTGLKQRADLKAPVALKGLQQLKTADALRSTLCSKARSFNGLNGQSNLFKGQNNGLNGQSNLFKGQNNGLNGQSSALNGRRNALSATTKALTGAKTLTPQAATTDIITTQPEGELHDNLYRSGQSFVYLWMAVMEQDIDGLYGKTVEAADGKTVYLYNPVNSFYTSSWIKGTRAQGDTLEVKLPQHIAHISYSDDESDTQDAYVYKMKYVEMEEDGETYHTFVPDDDQTAKFIYRNDSLIFVNSTDESKLLGVADEEGNWYGYGDYVSQWGKFTGETVAPEATYDEAKVGAALGFEESGQVYARVMKMVQQGGDLYIQGLNRNMPQAWAKGAISGDKAVFKSKQFMGLDTLTESFTFFQPLGHAEYTIDYGDGDVETYLDYCLTDSIVFTYNAENDAWESDSSLCVNQGFQQVNQIYTYDMPVLTHWTDKARTPGAPRSVSYEPYEEDLGCGFFNFIPYEFTEEDEEGNIEVLDANQLYYNVYVDDDIYTFDPEDYTSLTEPLTNIYYDFSDGGSNIITYGGMFTILTYMTGFDKIGVQAVYTGGGETRKSPIVYVSADAVKNATAEGVNVTSTSYTDLLGRTVNKPMGHGVFVKSQRLADGTVKSWKVVK